MALDHVEVRALTNQRVGPALPLQLLAVNPAPQRSRRVVAVEDPEVLAAAPERVQDAPHRVDAVELVQLLEPDHRRVAARELHALELERVVGAAEDDALPRRQVRELHRRDARAEPALEPQLRDRPRHLLEYRVAQRVREPAHHHRVGLRVR